MRDCDLADSPLASHWPDPADDIDSPADILWEAAQLGREQFLAAYDRLSETPKLRSTDHQMIVFQTIRRIFGDTRLPDELRMIAASAGIAANDPEFDQPYQFYGDYFGKTRACVHRRSRDKQEQFGLRARRDKADSARAVSRKNASVPRAHRRPKVSARDVRKLLNAFPGL